MAKNIKSLQLLRNGQLFNSYTAAVAGITGTPTDDGVIKLARYTDEGEDPYSGGTSGNVKTIFGIYHTIGEESGYTIYESYKEVIEAIKEKINAMGGEGGSIEQQIKTAIETLDYSGVTTGDGVVVTNVTEDDGKVSATTAEVGSLKLTNYSEGSESGRVAANDSINAAIAKLQNQIDAANDAKDAAIDALDANITAANGSYIDHIEQVDGKISGTTKELPSLAEVHEDGKPIIAVSEDKGQLAASAGTINAEFVNVADAGNVFTATTVEGVLSEIDAAYKAADAAIVGDATTSGNTLGKLEDRIEALDADAKEYSIKQITTGLSTNVKEAWGLFDADNKQSGATINIYKDSAYKEIYLGTSSDTINTTTGEITKQDGDKQSLNYAYMKADGTYDLVKVDVSAFLSESEFQSGVTAVDHIVRGVVDPSSEKGPDNNPFLTVGASGFKLDGVQKAIAAASGDVKTKLDELSGKTVTGVEMTGGTAAVDDNADGTIKITINTDGSQIKATGYSKGTDRSAIAATDNINTALAKLENQVAAAKTTVNHGANNEHVTVTSTTADDGSVTYTVVENDIASKSALDTEIDARKAVDGQSGQTYTANVGTNYILDATSLNDADVKLDAALKAEANRAVDAESQIDGLVGLVKDSASEGRTYTNSGEYIGKQATNSVASDIKALDTQVKANADAISTLQTNYVSGATMNNKTVSKANNVLAFTAEYTNTAADSTNGMVITTGNDGGLTFQFGTIDAGTY